MFKAELLSPAGSLKAMHLALAYGADAVYAGQPRFSLRVRNNEFDVRNLGLGIEQTHAAGKRFYVVANIVPHNSKVNHLLDELAPVVELGPDALIVSDPGVIWLLRQQFPHVPLHLSVQANTLNWAAVRFWQEQGIARIILSRELSIEEIAEIRQRVPDMELEVFVHGALCMAYSGRCLLSGYFNKRDPNQGACTNACRWDYKVHPAQENAVGQWQAAPVLLEDPQRPGELLPMDEDEHGSYIMNSRDLRALEYVEQLVNLGVHSLKIEGRTKSPYYAARTAQVYRQAIDAAVAGKPLQASLFEDLDGLANRGYTPGFLRRHIPAAELQNYATNHSDGNQQWVGEFCSDPGPSDYTWVDVKNRFHVGDKLLLLSPSGNVPFTLEDMLGLDGTPILTAPGSGHRVAIPLPVACDTRTALLVRLL
ncbi:tRNA 5-hydroxyuridine modification protein YegQ [Marinimicrobium sp. ABcell2]|uniref:prephenate-dependent tRNA uridine(34) hydroxylase TrhP n=1 Tax=Marinimicrobium sp. ABcell2 TaxID=3069751 RepID=UPI0027AEFD1A|nr:tRNA 5-hydroxyuridine modification protein YegQ [Marinimicrobium sp. ABcell2]MDQ2075972.1 tRNA 5-hydroxyuridine modification protein YegQ [Marinimicrobium sp. ABcell2]